MNFQRGDRVMRNEMPTGGLSASALTVLSVNGDKFKATTVDGREVLRHVAGYIKVETNGRP